MIDESTFSMEIGPKINAVGRIYENYQAMKVVELLTSDDKNNISSLSNLIKEINENKKALVAYIKAKSKNIRHSTKISKSK